VGATTAGEVEALLRFEVERPTRQASANRSGRVAGWRAGTGAVAVASAPASSSPGNALSAPDRALFAKARAAQAQGQFAEARTLAAPLFQAYPDVYAVQELRCQVAMKVGLSMATRAPNASR